MNALSKSVYKVCVNQNANQPIEFKVFNDSLVTENDSFKNRQCSSAYYDDDSFYVLR